MSKNIKLGIIIFFMFFCVNNLFSATNDNLYNVKKTTASAKAKTVPADKNAVKKSNVETLLEKDNSSVAYLVLESGEPEQYKITGKTKKDKRYNADKYGSDKKYFVTGVEVDISQSLDDKNRYFITGLETDNRISSKKSAAKNSKKKNAAKSAKKGTVYTLTGSENRFNLTYSEKQKIYNISGTEEINKSSSKVFFTKFQKEQLNNIEMEKKYKILVLDKEISSRRKSLNEELSKEFFDVYFIDKLSDEIKQLVVDKETVTINSDKKIRYVLSPKQYVEYKSKQNKQKKKKFFLFNKH